MRLINVIILIIKGDLKSNMVGRPMMISSAMGSTKHVILVLVVFPEIGDVISMSSLTVPFVHAHAFSPAYQGALQDHGGHELLTIFCQT